MFIFRVSRRSFQTSSLWLASDKSLLSKLRKSTGYTFANCKKALEVSNNDLVKAEEWLKEQALALGWAKAAKVAGRPALQGLIAITTDSKAASFVEVNCETDFVAKNATFHDVVVKAANACFNVAKTQTNFSNSVATLNFDSAQLNKMLSPDGKSLEDEVALLVSQVGENVSLRRAMCLKVADDLFVSGCTHPSLGKGLTLTGKYGSLLIYKSDSNDKVDEVAKQLCQHVIGMKPTKVGDIEKDLPKENKEEETVMIHQQFIMDPEISVFEMLTSSGISLERIFRFECGEEIKTIENNDVDNKEDVKVYA